MISQNNHLERLRNSINFEKIEHTMKKLIPLLVVLASTTTFAQRIKIIDGDLKALNGQSSVKTEFTYDNMIIGKNETEAEYIAEKKGKLDAKEAGRGNKWEQAWKDDRKNRFEPQFRELFAKHSGMSASADNAPYTLIFKTTRTEPGFNVGVMRMPAYIDGEVWIVETSNPSKVIAKLSILKAPGRDAMGFDYETGVRLEEAYAKAGKEIGQFITKNKAKK
jgi:hypothetical protein